MSNFLTDDQVSAALDYLSQDPHPVASARADVTRAENTRKSAYANAFLNADGKTIDEKKARAEITPEYELAKKHEADAILKFRSEEARVNNASLICELWRSVQANARAAERVR